MLYNPLDLLKLIGKKDTKTTQRIIWALDLLKERRKNSTKLIPIPEKRPEGSSSVSILPNTKTSLQAYSHDFTSDATISRLLKRYKMTQDDLSKWNPGKDLNKLKFGDKIRTPAKPYQTN
jgi:hypothetical protein